MKLLIVDELKSRMSNWSSIQCDYYSEACIVQLEELGHASGINFIVSGEVPSVFSLAWSSTPNKSGWKATAKLTENAATAIAFLLIIELTEYTVIEEAKIGTGIDYWLGYHEGHELYDEDNFLRARLEVSGIRNNISDLGKRINTKIKQTNPTDNTMLPAYIVVAEFSSPTAMLIKK